MSPARAAVAGGAGVGARGARADPQCAAGVAPADRAAAGADGVHVDHRQLDRAAVDLARVGAPHLAVLDHADVAGGASHVEPEGVAVAGGAGEQAGPDGAARRAGENAPGARPRRLPGGRDAARGAHHDGLRQTRPARRLAEAAEVAAEQGGEIGVDRGRRAALVLAEARQHLVRGGDVDVGERAAQVRGDRPLVRRVEVGEEQADRDRLGAALADQLGQPLGLALGERLDLPLRADSLRRLEAQLGRDERRRLRPAESVQLGPVLAADLKQVGEARRRDQRRARAAFLKQRVGADRHTVGEGLDLLGADAGASQHLLHRGDHAERLVGGRARQLRRMDGLAVDEHGVGEGPAHVDSEQHRLSEATERRRG